MINSTVLLHLAWETFKSDRAAQAGAATSGVSLWGSYSIGQASPELISQVQPWVAFFAAVFGGLSACATFVYVCIKIRRLLRNPRAAE